MLSGISWRRAVGVVGLAAALTIPTAGQAQAAAQQFNVGQAKNSSDGSGGYAYWDNSISPLQYTDTRGTEDFQVDMSKMYTSQHIDIVTTIWNQSLGLGVYREIDGDYDFYVHVDRAGGTGTAIWSRLSIAPDSARPFVGLVFDGSNLQVETYGVAYNNGLPFNVWVAGVLTPFQVPANSCVGRFAPDELHLDYNFPSIAIERWNRENGLQCDATFG